MQTSISAGGQSIGVAGQIADSGPHDIVSGFNKDTAQIPFGYGVMGKVGDDERAYCLPTGPSGTMEVVGLNVFDLNHSRLGSVDAATGYAGDVASGIVAMGDMQVGRKGRYLVPVENTVQKNDRLYCRVVATGNLTQGSFHGTNLGGSYMRDCTAQGIFRSGTYTAADGVTKVAIVEVDFTAKPA